MQTVAIQKENALNKLYDKILIQPTKYFPSKTQNVRINDSKKLKILSYKKFDDQKLQHIETQKATQITFLVNQHKEDPQNKKSYLACKQKLESFQPLKKIVGNLLEIRKSGLKTIDSIDVKSEKKILGTDVKSPSFRRTFYKKRQGEHQKQSTFCRTYCLSETKQHRNISLEMRNVNIRPPISHMQNYRPTTRFRKVSNICEESNSNFLARYEIIRQLGKGTYGTVYLAKIINNDHNKQLNKPINFNSLRLVSYESQMQEKSQKAISKPINALMSPTKQQSNQQKVNSKIQIFAPLKAENLEQEQILHLQHESQHRDEQYINLDRKNEKVNSRSISLVERASKNKQNTTKKEKNSSLVFTKTDQKDHEINNLAVEEQNELVAIKVYEKFKMNKDPAKFKNIRKQITIMQNLAHEGVIKLYESVESITKISLVVQFGGDLSLLDYLKKNFPLSKEKLKDFTKQLLETIVYLHEKNIVHRDIKPQNILVKIDKKNKKNEQLKLIDYGFSTLSKFEFILANKSRKINVICGTPNFMAPQLLSSKPYYGEKADVWSFGVVAFVMAEGRHPFKGNQYQELTRIVNKGKYIFKRTHEQSFQQFIAYILKVNGQQRPSANQILKHKWLQQF